MPGTIEREIKLQFDTPDEARASILAAGGTPLRARRLQCDALLDTEQGGLRNERLALRVRVEDDRSWLTFKGAPQPSSMKVREEIETSVGDAALALRVFERLGFRVWFRYEKYREEYTLGLATIAVDETPVGTFVEIEGSADSIHAAAAALGRTPAHYVTASYRSLYVAHCTRRGMTVSDMTFEADR
ncbi:MAG: class IV adenylate cyclase [Vicinamibacterales bacterium]